MIGEKEEDGSPGIVVRFLGSGDAFGDGGRFQACILVDTPGLRVLVANAEHLAARKIVLTHMGPSVLALAACAFERAYDGATITL